MSFGLGRGRALEPGNVAVSEAELPRLTAGLAPGDASARVDPRPWFEHPERALEVEIGCGKGTFALQHGAMHPEVNLLGIEWAKEFFAYCADRVRRAGLTNVRMLHADAAEYLRWRMPDGIVSVLHLYFSDPWPKARHHKRRVVQDRFLEDVARVLVAGGELRIVTDHEDYWRWMEERFERWAPPDGGGVFVREAFGRAPSAGEGEVVGTNFERKYAREGRPFHATVLRKPTA